VARCSGLLGTGLDQKACSRLQRPPCQLAMDSYPTPWRGRGLKPGTTVPDSQSTLVNLIDNILHVKKSGPFTGAGDIV